MTALRAHLARRAPVLVISVAALAVLGPFGTFQDLSLAGRLAYWGGLLLAGTLEFDLVVWLAKRMSADLTRSWRWMLAAGLLTVSVVQTGVVALIEQTWRNGGPQGLGSLLTLYGYVLVVTLLVAAPPIWLELRRHGVIDAAPPPAPPTIPDAVEPDAALVPDLMPTPAPDPGTAPFLDRIPPRLGRNLLALEMEDHYVRVHTDQGSDLILLRLRDAIGELTGMEGMQVHRSHWVADRAVAGVERTADGRLTLVLTDSRRVPVSRRYNAAVRAAGWTERNDGVETNEM
ncbi:LytTR family DNA-binding domain-containing protein [Azospirillum griseum]|uniref:LytTR family transcriptional regulator n=1 Tax=Azospirillum griseum TaxID=2496639 RepID=A0A3S0K2Y0_9PROT|nr:LytTR family DNA-binding domain-containing protein [Azospirillum griseum]RTR17387.1 LytTR family transcriptional regulator [Azospirillum griseum]